MRRYSAVVFTALVFATGCGGGNSDGDSSPATRARTPQVTTPTPATADEAARLVRSASDRLARVREVAQARQCDRKAEVRQVRDKTLADARALARFARRDGRRQVRRLMRVSIEALGKGVLAADSFLASCR